MVFKLIPGLLLALLVGIVGWGLGSVQAAALGRVWLDPLVLAILIGAAVRTAMSLPQRADTGIRFASGRMLEFAIALLGVSLNLKTLSAGGIWLLVGAISIVLLSLGGGYLIGRLVGLSKKMSVLIASGNSICGNAAIVAVAPAIGARREDVATSIAFSAVLGVVVIVILPFLAVPLGLGDTDFGILAGMTVYAVPHVIAATAPIGAIAIQVGVLVKMMRVVMLGPVVALLAVIFRNQGEAVSVKGGLTRYLPWFVILFAALALMRTFGLIPEPLIDPAQQLYRILMLVAMAALGLGVDLRAVLGAGPRVTAVVTASILMIGAMAYALIQLLPA